MIRLSSKTLSAFGEMSKRVATKPNPTSSAALRSGANQLHLRCLLRDYSSEDDSSPKGKHPKEVLSDEMKEFMKTQQEMMKQLAQESATQREFMVMLAKSTENLTKTVAEKLDSSAKSTENFTKTVADKLDAMGTLAEKPKVYRNYDIESFFVRYYQQPIEIETEAYRLVNKKGETKEVRLKTLELIDVDPSLTLPFSGHPVRLGGPLILRRSQKLVLDQVVRDFRWVIMSGSPGTGKSVSLNYQVLKLLSEGGRDIFCHGEKAFFHAFLHKTKEVHSIKITPGMGYIDFVSFFPTLQSQNSVYLFDPLQVGKDKKGVLPYLPEMIDSKVPDREPEQTAQPRTIIAASPRALDLDYLSRKYGFKNQTLGDPTEEEFREMAQVFGVPTQIVDLAMYLSGPILRFLITVYQPKTDVLDLDAIKKAMDAIENEFLAIHGDGEEKEQSFRHVGFTSNKDEAKVGVVQQVPLPVLEQYKRSACFREMEELYSQLRGNFTSITAAVAVEAKMGPLVEVAKNAVGYIKEFVPDRLKTAGESISAVAKDGKAAKAFYKHENKTNRNLVIKECTARAFAMLDGKRRYGDKSILTPQLKEAIEVAKMGAKQ